MFLFGKLLKYTCWLGMSIFFYHLYLVTNKEKPEEAEGKRSKGGREGREGWRGWEG